MRLDNLKLDSTATVAFDDRTNFIYIRADKVDFTDPANTPTVFMDNAIWSVFSPKDKHYKVARQMYKDSKVTDFNALAEDNLKSNNMPIKSDILPKIISYANNIENRHKTAADFVYDLLDDLLSPFIRNGRYNDLYDIASDYYLNIIYDTPEFTSVLNNIDDKKRAHTERCQSMKESHLLKEGPGAGYTISAEIKIDSIENIKLGKPVTLDGDFAGVEFTCDGKATATKITAESYAFGDTITGTFDVSFSKGVALEPGDIAESLIKECVGTTITTNTIYGGGWSHSTYDGTLTHSLDDTNSYVYVYFTDMELESDDIINYIDKAVTGENIITWYEVQDSEGEPVYNGDYFENSDDAVKFAKNNDTAVRVIEWTDIEDFQGDIDLYDDPRVIWQKRTFEGASRKSPRFKLSEMTQSELDAAKKEFQGKLRKRLGTDNLFSTYSQWTEEEKTEDTKFDCISMINSILAYDWNYKDSAKTVLQNDLEGYHSYLKKYVDLLGRDTVIELIQNQMDDIETVDKDTFSDSEGVTYNSIRWKRENLNIVKRLRIKE